MHFDEMLASSAVSRRLQVFTRILGHANGKIAINNVRAYVTKDVVSIGGVSKVIKEVKCPEYVPRAYYKENLGQTTLHHLRWMLQKDALGQDIFLLGPPGPKKRSIALQYLELTNREHEYVALSRDTTESDLKQRREIVSGTAKYFDQSAVRAATEGRVLILEGIEKAERNVLPVLNNLLENREMHLEDGRLLIPAERYDELLKTYSIEEMEKWKLVRVNEDFRVIALGLPIPRYRGNPLDPPLRSRFQARDVNNNSYQEWLKELQETAPNAPKQKIEQLLSAAFGLLSNESRILNLPDFPIDNLPICAKLLEKYPQLSVYDTLYRIYPYKTFIKEGIENVENLLNSFKVTSEESKPISLETIKEFISSFTNTNLNQNTTNLNLNTTNLNVNNAKLNKNNVNKDVNNANTNENSMNTYIETQYQNKLLQEILQTAPVSDFCIIGPRGCGKSILLEQMAQLLNLQTESIVLYQDMTSRDLVQQRTTLDNGDTIWKFSPLINAALEGKIAILDGLHRIHPSTLSVLHRLVHDREIQLHDGKRLISSEKFELLQKEFNLTREQLEQSGVLEINPGFRIVAIAEPPNLNSNNTNWFSPEILSLFAFHEARPLSKLEEMHIITSKFGFISKPLHQIIDLAHELRNSHDTTLKNLAGHLSTRQLLRIAHRIQKHPIENPYETIEATFMIKFLPPLVRQALEKTLDNLNVKKPENDLNKDDAITCEVIDGKLTIGNTTCDVYKTDLKSKVPNILFYNMRHHVELMEIILQDFELGNHILLVGNQGVGKNKIIDRFLQLLNRPREYIQLHRDTTVQTLTTQPTVKDGLLIHEDSPLVRAIQNGHVLVVDEADKAPTHVTCILKTLVETGQMTLSDGRRIVKEIPQEKNSFEYVKMHRDFRMVVLANRPGFPFLGNDFFGALGDLFSSHAVDNPSKKSEVEMLRQYGPNVPLEVIKKLVSVFDELRHMADQGLVSYPYSTREVVNIVKHVEKFPNTDIEDVIFNVFDFDKYSPELVETLGKILQKHGFSDQNVLTSEYIASKRAKEYLQVTKDRYSGKDTSAPKHGKEDPKNDPHVGGNTWAGGTGGRDTAGLGGKGGPYRLDKGHEVHQLSDEEKNAVPEHIQRAAREMGRKAFQEKLKEIGMSGYDANLYQQFSKAVSRQVQSLRMVLSTLQAKNKERQWSRHQTSGELDDVKLIDGILGEKTIFRRRAEQEPEMGTPQIKPKFLRLVVDVSGSMYRFNSYDGRLDRELEAVVLLMEALEGFEDKIEYDIIGHSGETDKIDFVKRKDPPKNNKERLDIVRVMHAHSQYCWNGDNTLEATSNAISTVETEINDESIVVILSDANLSRYGISPAKLGALLTSEPNVNAFMIFIGGLGDQAERLTKTLPAGRAFMCTDVANLPQILQHIFSSSVIMQ